MRAHLRGCRPAWGLFWLNLLAAAAGLLAFEPVWSQEEPASVLFAPPAAPAATSLESAPDDRPLADLIASERAADSCPPGEAPADKSDDDAKKAEEQKKKLAQAVATAYKPLFYNNDFAYLKDPAYDGWHLGETLKRRTLLGCDWATYDLGGEYRLRYHSEHNIRGKPLSGRNDDFLLQRTRLYFNVQAGERIRFYTEWLDASSNFQRNPPRAIEVNQFDALNLFVDGKLIDGESGDLWLRAGRQELLYGAERLVSPLDWANTRRTFDGFKAFWKGEQWDVDAFWTRPVPFAQHLVDDDFDDSKGTAEFMGLYSTYKGLENHTLDFFFLRVAEHGQFTLNNVVIDGLDSNLFGMRWLGKNDQWLAEVEGGYQFGHFSQENQVAGYCTVGLGRILQTEGWKPTVWAYYDWASGDADPGVGDYGAFNQYFPLAHKYFGFMDIFGRQNIQDINGTFTVQPHEKVTFLAWYHVLFLAQARDAVYDVGGNPIYQDPTGSAGNYLGQEIDLLLTWTMNPRMVAVLGYSHFFTGDYFRSPVIENGPAGLATNGSNGQPADFVYLQWALRF